MIAEIAIAVAAFLLGAAIVEGIFRSARDEPEQKQEQEPETREVNVEYKNDECIFCGGDPIVLTPDGALCLEHLTGEVNRECRTE